MTTSPPETPDPTPAVPERPAAWGRTVPRERLLDLAALLLLLVITAVLYLLVGPSAGMVTGTATGLYTTFRRTSAPPTDPSGADKNSQAPQAQ